MKRILYFILAALALASCSKDKETDDYDNENDSVVAPVPVIIEVNYSEDSARVTIPVKAYGLTCSSGTSTNVVLTLDSLIEKEYIYKVTGKTTSGSLTINSDHKLTMLLAGADIKSTDTVPAININCGKRVSLILQEELENHIADSPRNLERAALYTKGHLEIEGAGTLYLEGNARHALASKEYMQLKKTTGYIIVTSALGDAIHCGKGKRGDSENNYFKMNGGLLEFGNIEGDLIDADDYGNVIINGGNIAANVKTDDAKGIKADSLFIMNGGTINLNVSGDNSIGIQANYAAYLNGGTIIGTVSASGANGIKGNNSKSSLTVLNGGNLYFSGTTVTLDVTGASKCHGIYAEKAITATGGSISLSGPSANSPGYKAQEITGQQYFNWTNK